MPPFFLWVAWSILVASSVRDKWFYRLPGLGMLESLDPAPCGAVPVHPVYFIYSAPVPVYFILHPRTRGAFSSHPSTCMQCRFTWICSFSWAPFYQDSSSLRFLFCRDSFSFTAHLNGRYVFEIIIFLLFFCI